MLIGKHLRTTPHYNTSDGEEVSHSVVFKTNFSYMAGGAAVMLLGMLSVLPIFYGYWNLGPNPRLNPFEIAQVFEGPTLAKAPGFIDGNGGDLYEDNGGKIMFLW